MVEKMVCENCELITKEIVKKSQIIVVQDLTIRKLVKMNEGMGLYRELESESIRNQSIKEIERIDLGNASNVDRRKVK